MFITACLLTPAMVLGQIDASLNPTTQKSPGLYYVLAYLVMPLLLVGIVVIVQRVDPIELLFNFRHIYAIMTIEITLLVLATTEALPINLMILENRIVQFFAHVYYYLPIIYFAARPNTNPAFGLESLAMARAVRNALHLLFGRRSVIYIAIIIALLCVYNLTSGYRYLENVY